MTTEALISTLKLIESLALLSYGLSFALVYNVVKVSQQCYSILLSLVILVLANLIMFGYMEVLVWWDELDKEANLLLNFCWYIGFSLFYLAAILSVYYIHKKENIRIGRFGLTISTAFCAAAILQLIQYTEVVLFQSVDKLGDIYTFGIPIINIAIAMLALCLALSVSYMLRFQPEGLRKIDKWSI